MEMMTKRQALALMQKLSHSIPGSVTTHLERRHSPPGIVRAALAHTVPLGGGLKDALSRHPFLQANMAPFQSTGLGEQSTGCISAPSHFLGCVPLYNAQTAHPGTSAPEIAYSAFDLLYLKVFPFTKCESTSHWGLLCSF